jgi:tRNA pseudouridine38-40 synthase
MARFRALIEYDGTDYYGFQRQRAEFVTIQGELERVISQLARGPVVITGAGRTDSGVHASGQVISFTIDWRHTVSALKSAINANLPEDIAVLHIGEVQQKFHPRYDARRRAYRYFVYNEPERSPLRRRYSWHVRRPLQIELMNEAAALLTGVHDFATFGLPPQGNNSVRELFEAKWQRCNGFLMFAVEANAFLFRMVRSLVGSLVAVGLQDWLVADFEAAFRSCDRNRSAPAAPPQGLFLASIIYED